MDLINEQTLATSTPLKGSCLCGAVKYEVTGTPTAFDLCHCSRCRESSGSAFIAELAFEAAEFEWVSGRSLIKTYQAAVRRKPPGYRPDILHGIGWTAANGGSGRDPYPRRDH
jgi:hypothetical protein